MRQPVVPSVEYVSWMVKFNLTRIIMCLLAANGDNAADECRNVEKRSAFASVLAVMYKAFQNVL